MGKIRAICQSCGFKLTSNTAEVGDVCPWCNSAYLVSPRKEAPQDE